MTEHLKERAIAYAAAHGFNITVRLGYGEDGVVWRTSRKTAVKVHERERNFQLELECYNRLAGTTELDGFAVPELRGSGESQFLLEIGIVNPPFVVDFGKVYLDQPPPYGDEQIDEIQAERWGERWSEVAPRIWGLLFTLRHQFGIHYVDPRPGNVMFE